MTLTYCKHEPQFLTDGGAGINYALFEIRKGEALLLLIWIDEMEDSSLISQVFTDIEVGKEVFEKFRRSAEK